MEDVLDVYQRPYDPLRPVICLDETNRQLIEKRRIPPKPGSPEREDYEYRRHGVADLFVAFEPLACKRVNSNFQSLAAFRCKGHFDLPSFLFRPYNRKKISVISLHCCFLCTDFWPVAHVRDGIYCYKCVRI